VRFCQVRRQFMGTKARERAIPAFSERAMN